MRKEADLPETLGLHGLRHSIASHLAMGGAQAAEIMTAMGIGSFRPCNDISTSPNLRVRHLRNEQRQ